MDDEGEVRGAVRGAHVPRAGRPRDRAARPRGVQRGARHDLLPPGRGRRGEAWYEGGGALGEKAVAEHRRLPADPRAADPGRPVRAGEDRHARRHGPRPAARRLDRPDDPRDRGRAERGVVRPQPVELVTADARGLPRENYRKLIDGYKWLVDQGCVVDPRAVDLRQLPHAPARSPTSSACRCIGWTGAHRFASDYCFTVANGDIPTEGVMCANWLYQQGLAEGRPVLGGRVVRARLRRLLPRQRAPASGSTITREVKLEPNPRNLKEHLARRCATWAPKASTTAATATRRSTSPRRSARSTGTRRASWAPRSCSIRTRNKWAEGLEGWHGVDQLGEDGTNPNYEAMIERFEARFGRAYAQRRRRARLRHRPRRDPRHRQRRRSRRRARCKDGLERIRWMPATNGGPAATSSSAPATTRATRATSSPSASCAAASCASTATTARSGR